MASVRPRVRVPETASAGEIVEIKTLISHPMESGERRDADGNAIPRDIVNTFVATFNGEEVFRADWYPAISANPYMAFTARIEESGEFVFTWTDDVGQSWQAKGAVTVV